MCVCVHVRVCSCALACVHVRACVRACLYARACKCAHVHVSVCIRARARARACAPVCERVGCRPAAACVRLPSGSLTRQHASLTHRAPHAPHLGQDRPCRVRVFHTPALSHALKTQDTRPRWRSATRRASPRQGRGGEQSQGKRIKRERSGAKETEEILLTCSSSSHMSRSSAVSNPSTRSRPAPHSG